MSAAERPQDREIDNLLLEERRFPPPPEFAAQANAKPEIYDDDFEAFWEREAASASPGSSRLRSCSSGSGRMRSGSRRQAQYRLQLRRPPCRERAG